MSRADDRPPIFPTKRAEQSSALISSDKYNTLTPFLAALSAICKASADFPTAGLAPMMCKPPLMKPPPSSLSNFSRPDATHGALPPTCSEMRCPSCVSAAVSVCESPCVFSSVSRCKASRARPSASVGSCSAVISSSPIFRKERASAASLTAVM